MAKKPTDQCDYCGWKGIPKIELGDIPDLYERLDPGSIVPSGECPKCGALCYPITKPKPRPHVIIHVGGGCLRGVTSAVPVDYTLLDYDVTDGDCVKVPDSDGSLEEAYAHTSSAEVEPVWHEAMMKAIEKANE